MRGFWGSRVRRRKTSSTKRGVEVRHPGAGAPVQGMQAGIHHAMPASLGHTGRSSCGGTALLPAADRAGALTELVEVGLGALGPRDGAHQAGLEERAPAVDEAALPSNVILLGTNSRA